MLLTSVTIIVFLVYFYYVTLFTDSPYVPKPSVPYVPSTDVVTHDFVSNGVNFQFQTNSVVEWEAPLPKHYKIDNEKIVLVDVCHGEPDGVNVLATGRPLYEYLQNYPLLDDSWDFEQDAPTTLQDKRVFYFTCRESRIDTLKRCPPGQVFQNGSCHTIDVCTGQKDGKRFANVFDLNSFYTCHRGNAISHKCPPDTVFLHDKCVKTDSSSLYCTFHTESKILNPKTLQVCRNNRITYETCPPGFQYFDRPVCESNACDGKRNGAFVPFPKTQNGPFIYSAGYLVCDSGKVEKGKVCPHRWDPNLSEGDDLTHLPLVFDGNKCSIPSFCTNVQSSDANVVVPVHEFTKNVPNWKYSQIMDRVTGYSCEQGSKKRIAMDPGYRINKRFKKEFACDQSTFKVPISGQPDKYYDCNSQQVESCANNFIFDTVMCVPRIKNAFSYNGLDFFVFDSLRDEDNWMLPYDYSGEPTQFCTGDEFIHLETFNICSHPDCVNYPFLSQIPFHIATKDGFICVGENKKLVKKPTDKKYWYWSQQPVEDVNAIDTCVPGNPIRSGNFIWDSTIYATCDDQQPFVFCPSSSTAGIDKVNDKRFACMASTMVTTIPPNTKIDFLKNEIKQLIGINNTPTIVLINDKDVIIPPGGLDMKAIISYRSFQLETMLQEVQVEFEAKVTYPPDVVLGQNPTVSRFGGGYLMKRKDFTQKSLKFPTYRFKKLATDFKTE